MKLGAEDARARRDGLVSSMTQKSFGLSRDDGQQRKNWKKKVKGTTSKPKSI